MGIFIIKDRIVAISKTLRFETFKRDNFQCQYCGRTPPEVTLEIDHIQPRKKKGKDNPENLITSCFDCNRGKGTRDLKIIPKSIGEKIEVFKERELQLGGLYKFQEKVRRRIEKDINYIDEKWHVLSGEKDYSFNEYGRMQIKNLLRHFSKYEIEEAIEISFGIKPYLSFNSRFRYVCGILWNKKRRKKQDG